MAPSLRGRPDVLVIPAPIGGATTGTDPSIYDAVAVPRRRQSRMADLLHPDTTTSSTSSGTDDTRPRREPSPADPLPEARSVPSQGRATDGDGLPRWLIAVVALAGVGLRLAILLSPLGRPDADEVITALMARNIVNDGYPVFFWGQHYGGTLEVLAVLVSLKVFGWSVAAMRIPTLVLVVVNALLVWRLGRRWLTERQAQLAGLLVWLGPPAAMWFGLHAQLFYTPTVTLGLVLGLAAYRVRADGRVRDYALGGLMLGLGIWTSSNIAYFLLPAALVAMGGRRLRTRGRELLVGAPVAAVAAIVGAWPFISDYLESGGEPLRVAVDFATTGTYPSRFGFFFIEGLPGALGFRAVYTHDWIAGLLGVVAYLAVLGVIGWSLRRSWPGLRRFTAVGWAAIGFAAYPFVYAAVPFVMDDGNLRYTFFVVPFVALILARAIDTQRGAAIALALTLLVSLVGLQRLYVISEVEDNQYRVGGVGDLSAAIAVLEREGIDAVYGDYWVAYRLTFETEERIIAASSAGIQRYDPYSRHVRGSDRSAWVVDDGRQLDELLAGLADLGVTAEVTEAGEMAVVIPDRPVDPLEVPDEARHR